MEAADPLRYLFEWFIDSHLLLRKLRRRLQPRQNRPSWLRPSYVLLTLVALLLLWYTGAWRVFYVNLTPGTRGGDAAITITTDHSTYLGDEGLAITITNHLPVSIYTHADIPYGGVPCAIDLYGERRDDSGQWVGYGPLGVGAGQVCEPGCSGVAPSRDLNPPPSVVMVLAPGASYTQRWVPNIYEPTNDPGAYRLVFRYSTEPYAAGITKVGSPDMPEAGMVGILAPSTATSALVRVVDDGLRPQPFQCRAA